MNGKKVASLWLAVVMIFQMASPSLVWAVTGFGGETESVSLVLTYEGIDAAVDVAEVQGLLQVTLQDYLLSTPSEGYQLRRWIGADLERDLMTEPIVVDGVSYLLSAVVYQGTEVTLPLLFVEDDFSLHLVFEPWTEEQSSGYDDLDNEALSTALAAMAAGMSEETGKQARVAYGSTEPNWAYTSTSDTANVYFYIQNPDGGDPRSGTSNGASLGDTPNGLINALISSGALSVTPPDGFVLSGWYMDSGFTQPVIADDTNMYSTIKKLECVKFYAKWEVLTEYRYQFQIAANNLVGETYQSSDVTITTAKTFAELSALASSGLETTPQNDSYIFDGWYTDASYTKQPATTDSYLKVENEPFIFYGRWLPYVTVTYDVNGGEDYTTPDAEYVVMYSKATQPKVNPTHASGQRLSCWTTVANDPDTEWNFDDEVTGNMTLYAFWEDPLVVSFYMNGADSPAGLAEQIIVKGEKVEQPSDVVKEGHTIAGWYEMEGASPSDTDTAWNFNNTVSTDMVLYPKWEIQTFTVYYYKNGGNIDGNTNFVSERNVEWGSTLTDIAVTTGIVVRPGYIFQGWVPDIDGFIGYWDFASNIVTSNINLTAEWVVDPNDSFSHIVITKNPKLAYEEGELFDPEGLVVTYYMTSGLEVEVEYKASTADSFTFSIPLTQQLTTADYVQTVTVEGLSVDIPITVTEVPEYNYVYGKVYESTGIVANEVTVWLMQNGSVMRTTTTDSSGSYSFLNVGSGLFNVYVFQNVDNSVKSATLKVTLTGVEQTLNDIVLPSNLVSTVVSGKIQAVDNLDSVASYLSVGESGDAVVVVELAKTDSVTQYDTNYITAYKGDVSELGEFFSLSLTKRLSSLTSEGVTNIPILTANELIEITIALSDDDKHHYDYGLYRLNQGILEKLTSTPNEDGEYVVVDATKSYLTFYVKKFSSFAISYSMSGESDDWESDTEDDSYFDNELGEYRYAVRVYKSVNGSTTSDVTQGGNFYLSETHPIHSTKVTIRLIEYTGFMVDSIVATDRNGNNVQVIGQDDGTYYFTQAGSAVDLLVSFINPSIPVTPDGYTGFFDVSESDWFYNYVLKAAHLEYMAGVGNGYFNPNGEMTRGMIVQVLYNLAGKPSVAYEVVYSDLSYIHWYWEAVLWARSVGVADGYAGMFRAEDAITREELALMLYKYAQLDPQITQIVFPFEVSYADDSNISTWAKDAIRWCTNKGVFVGKDLNYFYPSHKTSRAEVATCLLAYLNQKV